MTPAKSERSLSRLPLWRLVLGIGVLGGFVAVIGFLTPVYVDDMRLHEYVVSLEKAPDASVTPDETLRQEVVGRARQLDLPVRPQDIQIVHNGSKLKIGMRYVVEMNVVVYPVDLHFPTIR
jgi:hypothetical protein